MTTKAKKPDLAIGVRRTPGGWSLVEYQIKDGKVVSEKVSTPELRAFVLERLSTAIQVFWNDV